MKARLQFGPGTSVGFTPAGIAAFTDLRPAAVVRELIQNSYDAAREAGEDRAVVRFCLDTMSTGAIPDIDAYEDAFDAAIETQEAMGGIAAKAAAVRNAIDGALQKQQQEVLAVLDNGIGLDDRRMTALLSDGVSAKSGDASGTFGNGHSVAIPASDLRYLLYGGVSRRGQAICAGHAVLASHAPPDGQSQHLCSGDGFFVRKLLNGKDGRLFEFAKDDYVPPVIQGYLSDVLATAQHGSAVIIPAFNHFRMKRKRSLWDIVAEAAACNFFHAIAGDKLVVHVDDRTAVGSIDTRTLDKRNIAKVLIAHRDKKRSRAFLAGEKAYSAFQVLRRGTEHVVKTSYGLLRIHIGDKSHGPSRVDLCRNGMWITYDKHIPGFANKFRDRRPFHALLLLDPHKQELYRLVREAEGPLHDRFDLKDMPDEDREAFLAAFVEIREWILEHTDKIADTSFLSDDYLTLDFGDSDHMSSGTPEAVGQRAPERTRLPSQPHRQRNASRKIRPTGRSRRQRVAPWFSAVAVPVAADRRRIAITCHRECKRAAFELSVDENIDSTCDRVARDSKGDVLLRDVTIDGQAAEAEQLVERNESVVGVELGDLTEGQQIVVETSFVLPNYFDTVATSNAALLVEVSGQKGKGLDP